MANEKPECDSVGGFEDTMIECLRFRRVFEELPKTLRSYSTVVYKGRLKANIGDKSSGHEMCRAS